MATPETPERTDRKIICWDCKNPFTWEVKEQKFFAEKGFKPPRRCFSCRRDRRVEKRKKEAEKLEREEQKIRDAEERARQEEEAKREEEHRERYEARVQSLREEGLVVIDDVPTESGVYYFLSKKDPYITTDEYHVRARGDDLVAVNKVDFTQPKDNRPGGITTQALEAARKVEDLDGTWLYGKYGECAWIGPVSENGSH